MKNVYVIYRMHFSSGVYRVMIMSEVPVIHFD